MDIHISLNASAKTGNAILLVDTTSPKIDPTIKSYISSTLSLGKNTAYKIGLLSLVEGKKTRHIIIVHCKDCKKINAQLEDIVSELGMMIKKLEQEFVLDLDASGLSQADQEVFAQLLAVNLYAFTKYKKDKKVKYQLHLHAKAIDTKKFVALCQSLSLTRDMVNDPAHSAHPEAVASHIHALFAGNSAITISVIKGKDLQKKGMNGIYEVGKGSEHAPRLVMIEYKGAKSKTWDYGLVGKGVCFDSGGYNIKPTGSMEDMKIDMAGAATVIGILQYAVAMQLHKNIIVGIPLVENLISGNAYKPGDVITMYNGKTVEIGNTDAEGRLILADTLTHVEKEYKPTTVFDFATLTGAQVVALGNRFAAILGRNHTLNKNIQDLSIKIKDRVWELPFYEPYFKSYKSDIADMNNINTAGRGTPGTTTAALFLSQFIGMKNWVHFDIAGPASIAGDPLSGGGATGCMLRLITQWLDSH